MARHPSERPSAAKHRRDRRSGSPDTDPLGARGEGNRASPGGLMPATERIVMPSNDGRRLSRRSLLQGAAPAGAAGLAVTAIGAAAPALAATSGPQAADQSPGKSPGQSLG